MRRRHRVYPFIPLAQKPAERMMLLKECNDLLVQVEPGTRTGPSAKLYERSMVEPIDPDLLAQTLNRALATDSFVATKYVDTLDALVLCLYQRSVPVWHRWNAENVMMPHFSEWRFTGQGHSTQKNPTRIIDIASAPNVDAEAIRARCSHINVVEKHVLLGDGTVGVLRTSKFGRAECVPGLEPEKFVPPVVEEFKDEKDKKKPGASPKAKAKGKKGKGKQVVDPAVEEAERRAEEKAAGFQSSPLMEVRDAVFHQPGCSFGMHPDLSWIARKRARHAAAQAHVQGEYQAALAA